MEVGLTMFGSYTNTAYSLLMRTYADSKRGNDPLADAKFMRAAWAILFINTLAMIGREELRDQFYGRPDKKQSTWWGVALRSWAGLIFGVRDVVGPVTRAAERETPFGGSIELPTSRVAQLTYDALTSAIFMFKAKNAKQREKRMIRFLDKGAEAFLMTQGLPYSAPKKVVESTIEIIRGR